jgi:exosortase D (VPLPA-CTERM-specific)
LYGTALACLGLIGFLFWDGLLHAVSTWEREEFSYGYIVPPLAALMVWHALRDASFRLSSGTWVGAGLVVVAAVLSVLARAGGMPVFSFYGFILALYGLGLSLYGWGGLRRLFFPIGYLFFALPLPNTLYIHVSTTMQHISSILATEALRNLGYSVYLTGNIIDLGPYQLQVAEACNGLRYLFPLASFAFLVGYLYSGPMWHRVVVFLSTVPITILINSGRVAFTGILVNYQGVSAAEGFMHAFEGWVIFLVGLLLLFLVQQMVMLVSGDRRLFFTRIDLDIILPQRGRLPTPLRSAVVPLGISGFILAVTAVLLIGLPEGARSVPPRKSLASFPLVIDGWRGEEGSIQPAQRDILRVDDYIVAGYRNEEHRTDVSFYVAWYDAQDRRATIHSPAVCMPAGGWEITRFETRTVAPLGLDRALPVNRSVIVNGTQRQVVYYWFELRHRQLTKEFFIKLANVWDALTMGRTDGALVRVVTQVGADESLEDADRRLLAFLGDILPLLDDYVPN